MIWRNYVTVTLCIWHVVVHIPASLGTGDVLQVRTDPAHVGGQWQLLDRSWWGGVISDQLTCEDDTRANLLDLSTSRWDGQSQRRPYTHGTSNTQRAAYRCQIIYRPRHATSFATKDSHLCAQLLRVICTLCLKNVLPLQLAIIFYTHSSTATIFGVNVAEKVGNQNVHLFSHHT